MISLCKIPIGLRETILVVLRLLPQDFFLWCVQQSWTTLAGVSPVTVIASELCS